MVYRDALNISILMSACTHAVHHTIPHEASPVLLSLQGPAQGVHQHEMSQTPITKCRLQTPSNNHAFLREHEELLEKYALSLPSIPSGRIQSRTMIMMRHAVIYRTQTSFICLRMSTQTYILCMHGETHSLMVAFSTKLNAKRAPKHAHMYPALILLLADCP
jgi:hypothetical protein